MPAKQRRQRGTDGRLKKDPQARERALEVLNLMRNRGMSLKRASQMANTTPENVRNHVGKVVFKQPNGRYAAHPSDRLTRHMQLLDGKGTFAVSVRGPKQAARIARYMAAVDRYLKRGETEALAEFEGQTIRSRGKTHSFLTDPQILDRVGLAGEVSFESIYVLRG